MCWPARGCTACSTRPPSGRWSGSARSPAPARPRSSPAICRRASGPASGIRSMPATPIRPRSSTTCGLPPKRQRAVKASELPPLLTPEYLQDLRGFARRFFRDLFSCTRARCGAGARQLPGGAGRVGVPPADGRGDAAGARGNQRRRHQPGRAACGVRAAAGRRRDRRTRRRAVAAHPGRDAGDRAQARRRRRRGDRRCCTSARTAGPPASPCCSTRTRRPAEPQPDDDAESLQHVFGYFAQRVFDGAAPEHRRALMQLAFLPLITVGARRAADGHGRRRPPARPLLQAPSVHRPAAHRRAGGGIERAGARDGRVPVPRAVPQLPAAPGAHQLQRR